MDCKLGSGSKILPTRFFHSSTSSAFDLPVEPPPAHFEREQYSKTRQVLSEGLEDLLYVDELTDDEAVACLLRRYLSRKYFTYYGNVLFYIQPLDTDPLREYHPFIYSNPEHSHLYAFLKEVVQALAKEQVKGGSKPSNGEVSTDLVRSLTRQFSTAKVVPSSVNYNVFFHGDNNFGQLNVTHKSLLFLTHYIHSLGLEPTGTFVTRVQNVLKLLDNMSDYNSNPRLCNYMLTYRMNFDEASQLRSISVVPNFATDLSCCVVANSFREFLDDNMTHFFPDLRARMPSLFYGLLHSISRSQNLQWFSECKIGSEMADKALLYMPAHEVRDPSYHVLNFSRLMELFLIVGFTVDDVKHLINLLCAIVLFDVYALLKNTALESASTSPSVSESTHTARSEENTTEGSDAGTGSSTDEYANKRIFLCDKDLLDVILEVLQIDVLSKPNSDLKYNDILFKLEMGSQRRSHMFDNISAVMYLRLKHLVYYKINAYLATEGAHDSGKSLSLHCNAGFNPLSRFIKSSDYHLAWYASEEYFFNKYLKTLPIRFNVSSGSEFIFRNLGFVASSTSREGVLTGVVLESIKYDPATHPLRSDRTVSHSWNDITYNLANALKIDATLYALPQMMKTLFKYSKNPLLGSIFFSPNSLHHVVGNCASALSYHFHLGDTVKDSDRSYFVACAIPVSFGKSNYQDRFNLLNFDETAAVLTASFTKKLPLLAICNALRNQDSHSAPLSEFAREYGPLVYVFASQKYHRSLPLLSAEQSVRLLFSLLSVPEEMYRTEAGILTMKRSLHLRVLSLLEGYRRRHLRHVVFIQRWWRGRRMPQVRRLLLDLVTRLQSLIRMNALRRVSTKAKRGRGIATDLIGYVVTYVHLNACLNSTSTKTLHLLHAMEKEFHDKEYEYLQHAAATYIQAIWRGAIQRKKYSQVKQNRFEEFSIVLIQSCVRRLLASAQILNVRNTKAISALMIQSYFRGYLARKRYQTLMQLKLLLLPILKKGSKINSMGDQISFIKFYKDHDSVSLQMKRLIAVQTNLPPGFVKVQNLVRMHYVRKQYLYLKGCLEKVHALAMTKAARLSYLEKLRAAVRIQRWWRCMPKDSFPSIGPNPIYYINQKEQTSVALLAKELKSLDLSLFHFAIHQDIRRIYPNTWAMLPLSFLKNIKLMQRSSADLNYTQTRKIDRVRFAVGSTHSLMLICTDNGSCVYSWGWNDKGQLGRRNLYPLKSSENDFMLMDPLEFEDEYRDKVYEGLAERINIVEIACGNDFSVAVSSMGRAFTWGDNSLGQCGQGRRLVRVHYPTTLDLMGVDSVCCGSYHTVVSVSGEYYVFGNAFGHLAFKPINVKTMLTSLRSQRIESVKCAGTTTVLVTAELDYVLNVHSTLHRFQTMYNLKGSIRAMCTNGRMICAIVEISRGEDQNADTKIYVLGQVRCVVSDEKASFTSKSLFVGAFKEKFENLGKNKTKQSLLNVYSAPGSTCFLEHPTELLFPKVPVDLHCDHQQLIITTNTGVYGTRVFQIQSESSANFEILDNSTLRIKDGRAIKLEPSLYQFTGITKRRPTICLASNSLSHSIGYTF